jgi:catalase
VNNNYRDGYMQPLLFEGASTSTPNDIGGVQEPSSNQTLQYTGASGQSAGTGNIGRYLSTYDWASQARTFWGSMDIYAQQHTVDGYRFELGHVADASVVKNYIDTILNPIDNCLARRVAFGIGAPMPAIGSGGTANLTNATTPYPSLYPLNPGQETNKSNEGLVIGIIAGDNILSAADLASIMPALSAQKVSVDIIASHVGSLASGINATSSFILTSSVLYVCKPLNPSIANIT